MINQGEKNKWHFSIGAKMTFFTVSIVFVVIAIVSISLFYKSYLAIEDRTVAQLESVSQLKISQFDNFIEDEKIKLNLIAEDKDFLLLLEEYALSLGASSSNNFQPASLANAKLQEKSEQLSGFFDEIILINEAGISEFSSQKEASIRFFGNEPFFRLGLSRPYEQYFYDRGRGRSDTITISRPIVAKGRKFVIAAHVNSEKISNIMTGVNGLGETGETVLINKDHYLSTESRFVPGLAFVARADDIAVDSCMSKVNGRAIYKDYRGIEVIGAYKWLPLREVCLISKIDTEEVLGEIDNLRRLSIFISFSALLLAVLLSLLAARSITHPIKLLLSGVKELADGNFNKKVEIKTRDELSLLAEEFNKTGEKLKIAKINELEYQAQLELEVRKKTEELIALIDRMKIDQKNLQEQRLAIANILEDVIDSQKKLQEFNEKLKNKRDELLALKDLSDNLTSVLSVNEITRAANSFLEKFFHFAVNSFLIFDATGKSNLIFQAYLNQEVNEGFVAAAKNDLIKEIGKYENQGNAAAVKLLKYINPRYLGKKLNNDLVGEPASMKYFPLLIGEKFLGLIQSSLIDDVPIGEDEQSLLDAFLNTMAFSVERVNSLVLAQHSKTASLVESLSNGVLMFDNNREITLVNSALKKFLPGLEDSRDLQFIADGIDNKDFLKDINLAMEKGLVVRISDVSVRQRYFEIFITPVKDNDQQIVGGALVFHDITYLKEIDQMKTEFVSVASHQLRTPLTAIKLFSNMLNDGEVGPLNEKQSEYVGNIKESTDRMVKLVNELLNVTRIESGRLRIEAVPTRVARFLGDIVKEASILAQEKNQSLVFLEKASKLPKVPLDINLFRQVVHNLIVNAIRYSPKDKGKIVVSLTQPTVDKLLISVSDNGIGIPEKAKARMFEKFFRADNAIKSITEGTGLGLYVSKMIVEQAGGKIWFDSERGRGSIFYIEVPLTGMKSREGERGLAIS